MNTSALAGEGIGSPWSLQATPPSMVAMMNTVSRIAITILQVSLFAFLIDSAAGGRYSVLQWCTRIVSGSSAGNMRLNDTGRGLSIMTVRASLLATGTLDGDACCSPSHVPIRAIRSSSLPLVPRHISDGAPSTVMVFTGRILRIASLMIPQRQALVQ